MRYTFYGGRVYATSRVLPADLFFIVINRKYVPHILDGLAEYHGHPLRQFSSLRVGR